MCTLNSTSIGSISRDKNVRLTSKEKNMLKSCKWNTTSNKKWSRWNWKKLITNECSSLKRTKSLNQNLKKLLRVSNKLKVRWKMRDWWLSNCTMKECASKSYNTSSPLWIIFYISSKEQMKLSKLKRCLSVLIKIRMSSWGTWCRRASKSWWSQSISSVISQSGRWKWKRIESWWKVKSE